MLSLAPQHADTRLTLADLLTQLGMVDDALVVLEAGAGAGAGTGAETGTRARAEGREAEEEEEEEEEVARAREGEGMAVRQKEITLFEGAAKDLLQVRAQASTPCTSPLPPSLPPSLPLSCPSPQDVRLKQQRCVLLEGEGRVEECADLGTELLPVLFSDVYHRSDIKGLGSVYGVGAPSLSSPRSPLSSSSSCSADAAELQSRFLSAPVRLARGGGRGSPVEEELQRGRG